MEECRSILLADLDAFFVSVEVAIRPELRGLPCAVTGGGRGVVLSATYPARRSGVTAGMPVSEARSRCPGLVLFPARLAAYRLCSDQLFSRAAAIGGVLERVSVDEAFWDVTDLKSQRWDRAADRPGHGVARWLRHMVQARFGLAVSVGLAASKPVAKIACEQGKPDGEVVVPLGEDRKFTYPLPVGVLPGVGPVAKSRLANAGVLTVGQLAESDIQQLRRLLGTKTADSLMAVARGERVDRVRPTGPPKSVSSEVTSSHDVSGEQACRELFDQALRQALGRLSGRREGARSVTVTHRLPSGQEVSASVSLRSPTDDPELLSSTALALHRKLASPRLRLAGVSFSGLSPSVQMLLDIEGTGAQSAPRIEPGREALTLGDAAYRGLEFAHPVFGAGKVLQLSTAGVAVQFSDQTRLMDPGMEVAV